MGKNEYQPLTNGGFYETSAMQDIMQKVVVGQSIRKVENLKLENA